MMLVLVLLFWAALLGAGAYYTLKLPCMADFKQGYYDFWLSVRTGVGQSKRVNDMEPLYGPGFFAGIITVIAAVIAVLIVFIATVVWAW